MIDAAPAPVSWSEVVPGPFDESRIREATARAREHVGGRADLAFVFVSCDLQNSLRDLLELVQIHAHCPRIVGCSAGGLIGIGCEDEGASGFTLLLLRMPGAEFSLMELRDAADMRRVRQWNENCNGWIVLGNPVHLGEDWMTEWNAAAGATSTYGGLASGSSRGEELFIFTDAGVSDATAIAVGFRGSVKLTGIVSQGCRPIGEPLTITRAENNLIHQLACKNAYEQLQSTYQSLTDTQREKAQGNILVGLAMSEYVEDFHTGDFLVRSIIGGDPNNGIIAVGAIPRVGQTLQFQLRDREAAHADLRNMLRQKRAALDAPPFASLLFSCAGRGKNLFGKPHHDAALIQTIFGDIPLAGLLCNGEIGTVGGKAHMHGFTASAAFFVAS
ncbi:MAG: FIST C-terminal domain-containing protein [Verrucomicrobia bacterium]|nr:FIST C-terminal domain-containing protein [Verrucomicrobiota bacterium]